MIRKLHKKKKFDFFFYFPAARVVLFYLTRPTGNDFLLKGGLSSVFSRPVALLVVTMETLEQTNQSRLALPFISLLDHTEKTSAGSPSGQRRDFL